MLVRLEVPDRRTVKAQGLISAFQGDCDVQGPRMVRDVFRLAKENAPAIIFIDEVDAIATARFDAQTGADRSAFLIHRLCEGIQGPVQG